MSTLRFGLIGYGLFGAHHARAIVNTPGAKLTAVAALSAPSQARVRKDHPTAWVGGDWRDVVGRADVDICDVVAPNHLHFEIAAAALGAGKHVLLEKPMALSREHCDQLVSLADDSGLVLAVNHELRLSALWGGAKQLIEQGKIGRPLHVMIELSRFPYRQGSGGWRYDIDRVGDWILEEPIHFFDLARWYLSPLGAPISVYARANGRQPDQPRLWDNFSALVQFSAGAYAVVSQTLAAFGHHQTAKITGTEGAIWAYWGAEDARASDPEFSLRYGLAENVTEVDIGASEAELAQPTGELVELALQIEAMVQSVRDGVAPPCSGDDGRWSTRLCLAASESVVRDEVVALEEE